MNTKLKYGLVASTIGAIAFAMIVLFPPSILSDPSANIRLVAASPSWPDAYTKIDHIRIEPFHGIAFSGTDQTITAEIGETWDRIRVAVRISGTLASSFPDAVSKTRVHVKIVAPGDNTIFDNYLTDSTYWGWGEYEDGAYQVLWSNIGTEWGSGYTLVEGAYTITTRYDIYV